MDHNNIHNHSAIGRLREEPIHALIFEEFTGDVSVKYKVENNVVDRQAKPMKGIVQRISDTGITMLGRNRKRKADTIEIPLKKRLNGGVLYGDAYISRTGERPDWLWFMGHLNLINKVIDVKQGIMEDWRGEDIYRYIEDAEEDIGVFMTEQLNAEMISAIYETASMGLSEGLDNAPSGIGQITALSSNLYWNAVNPSTGAGAITAIGDAGKNTLPSELNALTYSNIQVLSRPFLLKLKTLLTQGLFAKSAIYEGRPYWLVLVNSEVMYSLAMDDYWKKASETAKMGTGNKNPYYTRPKAIIFEDFIFVESDIAARKWNTDTSSFAGTTGYRNMPDYATSKNNNVITVLCDNALSFQMDSRYFMYPYTEVTNHGAVSELSVRCLCGVNRMEYVAEDDELNYFAANKATKQTHSSKYSVTNRQILQILVAAPA